MEKIKVAIASALTLLAGVEAVHFLRNLATYIQALIEEYEQPPGDPGIKE